MRIKNLLEEVDEARREHRVADLRGADLRGADLQGTGVRVVKKFRWPVVIVPGLLTIGCESHTPDEWRVFTDDEIAGMHDKALVFWKRHRDKLLALCDESQAEWEALRPVGCLSTATRRG